MTPDPFEDLGPGLLAAAFVKVAVLICLVSLALIGYGAGLSVSGSERGRAHARRQESKMKALGRWLWHMVGLILEPHEDGW